MSVELDREEMNERGLSTLQDVFESVDSNLAALKQWTRGVTNVDKAVIESVFFGADSMESTMNRVRRNIAEVLGISLKS